jgi:hypothetical protein
MHTTSQGNTMQSNTINNNAYLRVNCVYINQCMYCIYVTYLFIDYAHRSAIGLVICLMPPTEHNMETENTQLGNVEY